MLITYIFIHFLSCISTLFGCIFLNLYFIYYCFPDFSLLAFISRAFISLLALLERVLGNIFLSFLLGMEKKQPPDIWTSENLRFGQGLCRSFTKEPSKRRLKKKPEQNIRLHLCSTHLIEY